MQSRIATGTINKLSGEPWPHARVHFELANNVLESCDFAPPQCLALKANSEGLIEVPLLIGGTYKMRLTDGQVHEFTVTAGAGSFCLWDAVVVPPAEDYPWFVRVDGDTMEGDLDFDGNAIANAKIDSSNTIQFSIAPAGQRPSALELGETMYSPGAGLLWVGTGEDISYGVDGSQIIPAPPTGKGWREFSLLGGDGTASPSSLPLSIITNAGALTTNREYWAESLSLLPLELPSSALSRDRVIIRGFEGTKWQITQGIGQSIQFGDRKTTVGVSGRIESLEDDSMVELIYRSNGLWFVSHFAGNFEVT